jgi:hypothetical protein
MNWRTRSMCARRLGMLVMLGCVAALPVLGNGVGQSSATRQFQKTLTLGTSQTVSLTHKYGDVRIHGENGHDVKISATIRVQAHSQSEADRYAEQVRIDVSQDSQGIKMQTAYPSDDSKFFVVRVGGPSFSVDYDITVPMDAKLWMKNSFGNAEVRGVQGWADLENTHGQLKFQDGGSTKLTDSFGEVQANGADGNVAVINNNGAVTVSSVKGTLDVKDRFASISASNVTGAVTISGGNGPVEVTDVGASKINNSFGAVTARNIHGDLVVNNNNGAIDTDTVSGGAQLNGSFGGISFANVAGYVKCTSSNGRVSGRKTGSEVYVKTTFGEVSLEQIGGGVEVEDSNGGISVKEIKGKASFNTSFGSIEATGLPKGVRATTGNGRIALTDVGGDTYAKTSFGAVDIHRVNGNLTIENSNGPVTASGVKGDASAKTSFGSVTLDDVVGSITVDNQNGTVTVSAARTSPGCKNVSLKTSFAPMQVRLPADSGYEVNARTSFGHISSDLPVTATGTLGGDSLNGKIGNGGCTLSLTNSNGNIEILKLSR